MSGPEIVQIVGAILAAGVVAAVPLTLAALGDAVSQRAGLLNLGIEGMMLLGAFAGFAAAYASGNIPVGLAAGALAGLAAGALFGGLCGWLGIDQTLSGIAITVAGAGLTAFLYRDLYGGQNPIATLGAPRISLPLLRDLPLIGRALFDQNVWLYLAYALVPLFSFLLNRTRFGLNVRACGSAPRAADASGVDVAKTRLTAALVGGGMAGLAGAYLSVVDLKLFQPGMTAGIGFISLALVITGGWNPWRILLAAISFGVLRSLGTGLQIAGMDVQTELLTILPYAGVIVALALLARRAPLPAALGAPYHRNQR